MVSFALVLNPSTTPLESWPLARNRFSRRSRCYQSRHLGGKMRHFCAWYRRDGGTRSYPLQAAGLVAKATKRGVHRRR